MTGKLGTIGRTAHGVLVRLAKQFPVVTVIGPRQAGKTTLAKMAFPGHAYVNLEDPELRTLAQSDAREFLRRYPPPVILDEIQRVPSLLSHIQVLCDAKRENGRYILTGSHQPELRSGIAQSLAGRTAILRLLPLSISELQAAGIVLDRDDYLVKGFMPRLYDQAVDPQAWYQGYFMTYVERDALQLIHLRHRDRFELFLKLLAGRVGQLVNLHGLAGDIGMSSTTLAEWLAVLEASHIIFKLPCYFENFGKRFVKSPKLYFTEVGLATWLLGIRDREQVARDPLLGGLFENMVVLEVLKARYHAGREAGLYFLRDKHGMEVDLLIEQGRSLIPVEIKAARTHDPEFTRGVARARSLSPRMTPGMVVYAGGLTPTLHDVRFVHFADIAAGLTP